MRVRFWGTRGSIATPGQSTVRYGGNTSCVEVRSDSGALLLLDGGTGARPLGLSLLAEGAKRQAGHIAITHTHWDHIQGIPFFAPLFAPDDEWNIYGPSGLGPTVQEALAGQMQETYFPVALDQLASQVRYHDLLEGEFEVGDIHVTAQYLNHPAITLGYRLEVDGVVVVYATDHEPHLRDLAAGGEAPEGSEDEKHVQFLADADLVIHDAQYTVEEYPQKVGWGHSTIEYAVDSARSAHAQQLALYHHDPMRDDDGVDALVERARSRIHGERRVPHVFAAAEGQVWEMSRPTASSRVGRQTKRDALSSDLERVRSRGVMLATADSPATSVLVKAARGDRIRLLRSTESDGVVGRIREERPALVIVDRVLDGHDAFDLCREIRAGGDAYASAVPVVVVAEPGAVDAEAGNDAGVTAWLATPFSPAYARSRIRAWSLRTVLHWERAPLPIDETDRLHALTRLKILDTPPESRFDRYTRIAAALFDVPIALVSLVDRDRQWFKSQVGTDLGETPRDMSFCSYAINGDDVMEIKDTRLDPRFAENPLVTGEPRIRFYAGAPLKLSDGQSIGTLCLIDRRPRGLDTEQRALLTELARLVVREMEDDGE